MTTTMQQFNDHKSHSQRGNPSGRHDSQAIREAREEWGVLLDQCDALVDAAKRENREMTAAEQAQFETTFARAKAKQSEFLAADTAWKQDVERRVMPQMGDGGPRNAPRDNTEWRDMEGRPVHVLAKGDRWQDLPRHSDIDPDARLGEFIKCAITGNWRNASQGVRAAMSTGGNSSGGYLVPEELARRVIDLARAKSVLMQAGAVTVPMASDRLVMARVSADPTFEVKGENSAFTGSSVTFDQIGFSAFTVGTVITSSRELAEDAPNFVDLIESTLAAAFAAKLDNIGINGADSTHLDGILDWSTTNGIGETGSVGAIAWEDLHAAAVGVRLANHEPNAYVVNPDIFGDLSILTTGDGSNASKGWLPPPATVASLTPYQTTNIGTASLIVGDFTKFVWGIRQGVLLEVSRDAGNAFEKHQVLVKLTWRGDCNAFRQDAFHRLVGITT